VASRGVFDQPQRSLPFRIGGLAVDVPAKASFIETPPDKPTSYVDVLTRSTGRSACGNLYKTGSMRRRWMLANARGPCLSTSKKRKGGF
jgi:hypothetical protein